MSYQTLGKDNVIAALRERMLTMGTRCYASATIFQSKFKLSELSVSSQSALNTRRYAAYTKLADLFWAKNGCQHYFRGEGLQEVCGAFRIWLPPIIEVSGDDLIVVGGFEALARIIEEKKNAHDPIVEGMQVHSHAYRLPPHPCFPARIKKSLQWLIDFRLEDRDDGEPRDFMPVL